MARRSRITVRVHDRGDRRLDGILRLIEEAGRPRPIPDVLATLCAEIAEIARADVASVYVREGNLLIMRANVGFDPSVVDRVRLHVGEGTAGFVAECLRPVSVAVARSEQHYKHIPELGEEKFPSFLAVPLLVGGSAAGVLVLQRREAREFSPEEVALATALAAPVTFALERSAARQREVTAEHATTSRSARLAGTGVSPGLALGRVEPWPTFEVEARDHEVELALTAVAAELGRCRRRLEPMLGQDAVRLSALGLVLEDGRLKELMVRECKRSGIGRGLSAVAREYARAPYRIAQRMGEAGLGLAERAAEIEDLCVLVAARAAARRTPESGAVVVAQHLTAIVAMIAVAHRASAMVLTDHVDDGALGVSVARAGMLPIVAEVAGLFAWVRPGDRALVDGESGLVRVNPSATAIARFRARVKKRGHAS